MWADFFAFVCKGTTFHDRFRQDVASDLTGEVYCTYMYLQLHVHVYAIARTCICNEDDVSSFVTRPVWLGVGKC